MLSSSRPITPVFLYLSEHIVHSYYSVTLAFVYIFFLFVLERWRAPSDRVNTRDRKKERVNYNNYEDFKTKLKSLKLTLFRRVTFRWINADFGIWSFTGRSLTMKSLSRTLLWILQQIRTDAIIKNHFYYIYRLYSDESWFTLNVCSWTHRCWILRDLYSILF